MALDTNKVRKLMTERRILQRDLAMMSGVTEAAMSRYLAGNRQPKSETLANMATALHTTSNDLLGMEPPTDIEQVYSLVARSASSIPQDIKMKLIQLLSQTNVDDNITKG